MQSKYSSAYGDMVKKVMRQRACRLHIFEKRFTRLGTYYECVKCGEAIEPRSLKWYLKGLEHGKGE